MRVAEQVLGGTGGHGLREDRDRLVQAPRLPGIEGVPAPKCGAEQPESVVTSRPVPGPLVERPGQQFGRPVERGGAHGRRTALEQLLGVGHCPRHPVNGVVGGCVQHGEYVRYVRGHLPWQHPNDLAEQSERQLCVLARQFLDGEGPVLVEPGDRDDALGGGLPGNGPCGLRRRLLGENGCRLPRAEACQPLVHPGERPDRIEHPVVPGRIGHGVQSFISHIPKGSSSPNRHNLLSGPVSIRSRSGIQSRSA